MRDSVPGVAPRKWLGPKGGWIILAAMFAVWLGHLLFDSLAIGDLVLTPNTLVLGGFTMTAALIYTMAYRLRPDDGVTPLRLLVTFLIGGLAATELAFIVEDLVVHIPVGSVGNQSVLVHALAGIIEEGCKLLVVVVAARGLTVRTARSGLFMGGAVGLGFAAFEDMRYAFESVVGVPEAGRLGVVLNVTISRNLIGPLEHPIMSALIAAALFATTRNGRFRITLPLVGVYLVISAVHGLIDTLPQFIAEGLARAGAAPLVVEGVGLVPDVVFALLLGITWLIYTRRLRARALKPALAEPVAEPAGRPDVTTVGEIPPPN